MSTGSESIRNVIKGIGVLAGCIAIFTGCTEYNDLALRVLVDKCFDFLKLPGVGNRTAAEFND